MILNSLSSRVGKSFVLCLSFVFLCGSILLKDAAAQYTQSYVDEVDRLLERQEVIRKKINAGEFSIIEIDEETKAMVSETCRELYRVIDRSLVAISEFQYCEAVMGGEQEVLELAWAIEQLVSSPELSFFLTKDIMVLAIDTLKLEAKKISQYATEAQCLELASQDDPAAFFRLAVLCGLDTKEGMHWLEKAANRGVSKCMYLLGAQYLDSPGMKDQAASWFARALDYGYSDPECALYLGWCYEQGIGVTRSTHKASEFYRQAANKGEPAAMLILAKVAMRSEEAQTAYDWVGRAARKGLPEAMLALGLYYETGYGTTVDLEKAEYWKEKAAALGVTADSITKVLK